MPLTLFTYADDKDDFAQHSAGASESASAGRTPARDVPSYQVTREELHSTRGRAHLLWEMLQGDLVTDGWRPPKCGTRSTCLSCKGCLSDCPVNSGHGRPTRPSSTHHHTTPPNWGGPRGGAPHCRTGRWAGCAVVADCLPCATTGQPDGAVPADEAVGRIAPEREIPVFAEQTFTSCLPVAPPTRTARRARPLVAHTFTNYLHPRSAWRRSRMLEAAGYRVVLPEKAVCCGLTWISPVS